MSYSVCNASFFDFFNDGSVSTVGQELTANNFEAEDGRARGWSEAAFFETLLKDHMTHKSGTVYTRLP